MNLELVKLNKREELENLLQVYLNEINEFFPIDKINGKYVYESLDKYFNYSGNNAYFILNGNEIAGFMLVTSEGKEKVIQELFILDKYKHQGIGKKAVFNLLDNVKCKWIIRVVPTSPVAENFWINIIKEYTNGNFNLERVGKYNRAIIKFNSKNM